MKTKTPTLYPGWLAGTKLYDAAWRRVWPDLTGRDTDPDTLRSAAYAVHAPFGTEAEKAAAHRVAEMLAEYGIRVEVRPYGAY